MRIVADIKTDISADSLGLMSPMMIGESSRHRGPLNELVFELTKKAAGFRRSMPSGIYSALAHLVRSMNCYYSNLIEGHNTHPIDIERALQNDFSSSPKQRNLQLEAKAHIEVQKWIEESGLKESPAAVSSILEIHRKFCENLPEELLWVSGNGEQREYNKPGQFRDHIVQVGSHVAIAPESIGRFLGAFESVFANLSPGETVLASAAAHHRFLWIHPFLDGNGRVARLMSHAMLTGALETGGVWSISRGLARNAQSYKSHLASCDMRRRNDLDGRGTLSEEALAEFTKFFLTLCIDQIDFMDKLVEPAKLYKRITGWAQHQTQAGNMPAKAAQVLEAMLYRGELTRGEVSEILGNVSERHARRLISSLVQTGVIVSENARSPLRISFPAKLASEFTPGLFP